MINVIVISAAPTFCEITQEQLRDSGWTISFRHSLPQAEADLATGFFNICIIDGISPSLLTQQNLAAIKSKAGSCRFVAVGDASDAEIDKGYRSGLDFIFSGPPREGVLRNLLLSPRLPNSNMSKNFSSPHHDRNSAGSTSLDLLRDFSRILSHSLNLPNLVHHFVLKARESIGLNRIAVFLLSQQTTSFPPTRPNRNRLSCICSIGIPGDVQDCLELSTTSGIGSWIVQSGQILRIEHAGALLSPAEFCRVQHEFALLNCQIAIPINDRERTLGVAMLGEPLTRPAFSDEELQLIFHLMEELGLSIKNYWLHSQLSANNKLFGDVLASMKSGILVAGPDLEIIHANPAMVDFLRYDSSGKRTLAFADLPPLIAKRIHEVVENGGVVEPFQFKHDENGSKAFQISVIPLQNPSGQLPQSAMVVMEDFSEVENARKIAVKAANSQLSEMIAKRFAQEIHNSLAPLKTHLQLMDDRYQESQFQQSLKQALETETTRMGRLSGQMLFLTESRPSPSVLTGIEKLLREAFAKAQTTCRTKGILTVHNQDNLSCLRCDPASVTHAFQEIFVNGLQAAKDPQITVKITSETKMGKPVIRVDFFDSGPGFSEKTVSCACEPFFTSRPTGVGLGLTVARRAAEEHGGWLEIFPRNQKNPDHPDVAVFFPSNEAHEE